jgi:hypothetical protein
MALSPVEMVKLPVGLFLLIIGLFCLILGLARGDGQITQSLGAPPRPAATS